MATTKETTNAKACANTIVQLSFLNLEDDTSVVVQRLNDKYMTVLNQWHAKCGTSMDVDHLDLVLEKERKEPTFTRGLGSCVSPGQGPKDPTTNFIGRRPETFGCVHCDPRDTFVIDSRNKDSAEVDTITLPCDDIVVKTITHTLYCPFYYTFMNRIITNKDKFKSEYLPIFFQQMTLDARLKVTRCFAKTIHRGGGSLCTHKEGMYEYHANRRELFDLDKMGIVIPETFRTKTVDELMKQIHVLQSSIGSIKNSIPDTTVSPNMGSIPTLRSGSPTLGLNEGPYTTSSRQAGFKQPWYNGYGIRSKAGDFRGMQQESETELGCTMKTSPIVTKPGEEECGPSSFWSSYVPTAAPAPAIVHYPLPLPSLMAYNTVDYTGTPYTSANNICNHAVHVILNYHEYSVLVLTHSLTEDERNVLDHYQEYGFVKLFTYYAKTKTICDQIARMFVDDTTSSPVTVGIINKQMELAARYVVLFGHVDGMEGDERTDFATEEQRIIEFIQSNYVIDHTIEHRMKASAIFEICAGFLQQANQNEVNLRKRISIYLKKMNLQKKRYNDGYYYYGIREKTKDELHANVKDSVPPEVDTTYHPEI